MPKRFKLLTLTLSAVISVVLIGWVAGGAYVANEIRADGFQIDREPEETPLEVVSIVNGNITLSAVEETDSLEMTGNYGLEGPDGYWFVAKDPRFDSQVRVIKEFYGGFSVGDKVRLDKHSYPSPERMGLESADIEGPLGVLRIWQISPSEAGLASNPSAESTWIIGVHGRDSTPSEPLRVLLPLSESGYSGISITYRNDPGTVEDPSGYYLYGQTEWEDLQAAVSYALESGAEEIVLLGYSMGGAIVAAFMENAPEAVNVKGIIMDSPALDFEMVIDAAAVRRSIPPPVTWAGKIGTNLIYGLDLESLDYLSRSDKWDVPILIFHGDQDTRVPVSISRAAAEQRPDLVRYVESPGVAHVAAWNVDSDDYSTTVERFMQGLE